MRISLTEASVELAGLVEAALMGEDVVILKDDQPVVRLVRLEPTPKPVQTWQLCGRFAVSEAASVSLLFEDASPDVMTNQAEQVDDVLYQGF